MLTNLNWNSTAAKRFGAALLCGLAVSFGGNTLVAAQSAVPTVQSVRFADVAVIEDSDIEVRMAVETFIRGMSTADAKTVWMFASEEDQEAFETEDAVYQAFAETFPALTQVAAVTVESFSQEGDTPFVELSMTDANGQQHRASVGLWLDDAGDWKVISCDVKPASDRVAAL
jgi:hypothetical protein